MDIDRAKAAIADLHELWQDVTDGVMHTGDIGDRIAGLAIIELCESGCLEEPQLRMIGQLTRATRSDGPAAVWRAIAEYITSDITMHYTGFSTPGGHGHRYSLTALHTLIGEAIEAVECAGGQDDVETDAPAVVGPPIENPADNLSTADKAIAHIRDAKGAWITAAEIARLIGGNTQPGTVRSALSRAKATERFPIESCTTGDNLGYRWTGPLQS